MKYLIVGLGNPGAEYENTRHNVGFKILDTLAAREGVPFVSDKLGWISTFKTKGRSVILLKPSTFMNLSGKALQYWINKEKIAFEHVLVATDDLALPFGAIRLRPKGSDGGHNGLKSIQEITGRSDYARLRFGIGSEFGKGHQVNYVLAAWNTVESQELAARLDLCADLILSFVSVGIHHTMSAFNNK